MALYRENATGFVQEWASNPGAGYTAITAQPTDTLANRVTWWRNVDKGSQTSSWHPSEYRTPQDPAEAVLSMAFSKDAAFFSADSTGAVTDAYLGGSCTVSVYRGGTDVTDSEDWTLTKVDDGCASTLTKAGGVWTLTITNVPLLATKSGYVRVTATRTGSTTQVRDWNWIKVPSGANGANGTNGTNGTNGARGSRQILVTTSDGVWSDLTAWNGIVTQTGTTPVLSDLVTIAKTDGSVATSKFCTGNSASPGVWTQPNAYINGSLLVTGTVGADRIVANSLTATQIQSGLLSADNTLTRGLTVRDNAGNIILQAGTPLTGDYIPAGGANLLRAPVTWSPVGSTTTGTGERGAVDGSYLRFPASAPILQYTDSPNVTLAAGTYTFSIKAYNGAGTGDHRAMSWQLLTTGAALIAQDSTVLSSAVARYALTFTLASTTTLYARVFCSTTSAREARAFDIKIESGSQMTPWVSHAADQVSINNPINSGNASTYIADATITGAKIASATITDANIANATITGAKIADAAITTAKIGDAQITGAKIANATITAAQIVDATITSAKIASLDAGKITTGTLNAGVVTVTNLSATNITGGTLSVDRISANSITGGKISTTNGVDTANVIAGAITDSASNFYSGLAWNLTSYTEITFWTPNQGAVSYERKYIQFNAFINVTIFAANGIQFYVRVKKNGTEVARVNLERFATSSNGSGAFCIPFSWTDTAIGSSAVNYTFTLENHSSYSVYLDGGSLSWHVAKR